MPIGLALSAILGTWTCQSSGRMPGHTAAYVFKADHTGALVWDGSRRIARRFTFSIDGEGVRERFTKKDDGMEWHEVSVVRGRLHDVGRETFFDGQWLTDPDVTVLDCLRR